MKFLKRKMWFFILGSVLLHPIAGHSQERRKQSPQAKRICQEHFKRSAANANAVKFVRVGKQVSEQERGWSSKPLGNRKRFRVMTYNMYHLDSPPLPPKVRDRNHVPPQLTQQERVNIARTADRAIPILETMPDVVVMQEIKGGKREAANNNLRDFSKGFLRDQYDGISAGATNDYQLREIGFLVRRDLRHDFDFSVVSHADLRWSVDGDSIPVFVRDFPILLMRKKGDLAPCMAVFGVHLKSKRKSPTRGDDWVELRVNREIEEIKKIIEAFQAKYPHTPFTISGDFNMDINASKELMPLRIGLSLNDGMNLTGRRTNQAMRATSYFYQNNRLVPNQAHEFDGHLLSKHLHKFVKNSWVYRYRDNQGREFRVPQTYEEREQNLPSDHYPSIVDIDTAVWD